MNNRIFVNSNKINKCEAKDSEINASLFCLGNISKYFSVDNMKKIVLYEYVYDFSTDYGSLDVGDILHIHKYFMKKHDI